MDLTKPLLAIFAHPDDETFGIGGTIALAARTSTVTVVSATRGEKGKLHLPRPLSETELGKLREQELGKALEILGAQKPIVLDYPDGKLDQADPEEVIAKLLKIIDELKPHTIITFGPEGGTGHKDHIAICSFATEAFRRAKMPELYWTARPKVHRDIFLQHISSRPHTKGHYHEQLPEPPYQDHELEAIDILPVIQLKLKAAEAHASQYPYRIMQRIQALAQEFWRYEYFYKVPVAKKKE